MLPKAELKASKAALESSGGAAGAGAEALPSSVRGVAAAYHGLRFTCVSQWIIMMMMSAFQNQQLAVRSRPLTGHAQMRP